MLGGRLQAGGGGRTGVQVFSGPSFHTMTRWSKLQEASRLPNFGCAQVTCRSSAPHHAHAVDGHVQGRAVWHDMLGDAPCKMRTSTDYRPGLAAGAHG